MNAQQMLDCERWLLRVARGREAQGVDPRHYLRAARTMAVMRLRLLGYLPPRPDKREKNSE